MKIQNYDIQDDGNDDFVQLKSFMPNRCFRMLICAPSGGGKTNLLLDMIYRLLYFDKIYLYARNLSQSKYKHLLKSLEPISKEVGYDVIEASNDEIIPLTDLSDQNQKLIIFDDYLNTGKKMTNGYVTTSPILETKTALVSICHKVITEPIKQ